MEWVEVTGATVVEAQERALDQLGVDITDAEIEVVEEPGRALFGLRKTDARVRARVRPTAPPPRQERNDRRRGNQRRSGGRGAKGGAKGRGGKQGSGKQDSKQQRSKQQEPKKQDAKQQSSGKQSSKQRGQKQGAQKQSSGRDPKPVSPGDAGAEAPQPEARRRTRRVGDARLGQSAPAPASQQESSNTDATDNQAPVKRRVRRVVASRPASGAGENGTPPALDTSGSDASATRRVRKIVNESSGEKE